MSRPNLLLDDSHSSIDQNWVISMCIYYVFVTSLCIFLKYMLDLISLYQYLV